MEFLILGKAPKDKDEIKKRIISLGGKVVTKISNTVMAVISTPSAVEKMGSRMLDVESEKVHVVSEDFLDEVEANRDNIPDLVIKKSICNWGSDVSYSFSHNKDIYNFFSSVVLLFFILRLISKKSTLLLMVRLC